VDLADVDLLQDTGGRLRIIDERVALRAVDELEVLGAGPAVD
jgi:hypothetical protein